MEAADAVRVDSSFDRYARMVCRALGVPIGLVSLVEEHRQVFAGACGLPEELDAVRETPLSHSFCQHVVGGERPLVVADAREDLLLRDNLAIPDLGIIAYAGWPITDHTGQIVGSLCAIDREPRDWSAEQLEMLEDLAAACSTELSERALRTKAADGQREAQDLSHRSRVLLALSEGLSGTSTTSDVAAAVERISLEHLGCLRAGIWLRHTVQPGRSADLPAADTSATQELLTYVRSPSSGWGSAFRNSVLPLDDSNPLGDAIVHRRPLHFPDRAAQNRRYPLVDVSEQVGEARSFVPLVSRGTALGTIALVWDGRRVLSEEDRLTIEALTSYTAQAAQRAMLFQERLDALVTLQSSLLPQLPQPESLELAARYRPAASRDQVGGDWYDAVVMPSGATSLMIGDVVGHDMRAAAVMGQVRNMLRALAWAVDDAPSHNVGRLDLAMHDLAVDGMASLVYARIEQSPEQLACGERTLRWTNAGHPPPLVVSEEGEPTLLDQGPADLMLGVLPAAERTEKQTTIRAGSLLLLYTDGLVERRGEDITLGLERLCRAAARPHSLPVAAFRAAVLDELVQERLNDDVAVLAVRFHHQPG